MKKNTFIVDTTSLMSYFNETFNIRPAISIKALSIIDDAFKNDETILLIPSIVFIEIFSKQFKTEELAHKIRYDVFEKVKSQANISIQPFDKEVLEMFLKIIDIEPGWNFDNHDKQIFATAMKFKSPLITSDQRLIRYNKKKKLIPEIIR
jgi:hypothetical protein